MGWPPRIAKPPRRRRCPPLERSSRSAGACAYSGAAYSTPWPGAVIQPSPGYLFDSFSSLAVGTMM
jgi:hypothetical protein